MLLIINLACNHPVFGPAPEVLSADAALAAGPLRCEAMGPMNSDLHLHADGKVDLDAGTAGQGSGTWSMDGDDLVVMGDIHDPHGGRYVDEEGDDTRPPPTPTEYRFEDARFELSEGAIVLVHDGEDTPCR